MSESRKILCEVEDLVYEFGHDGFIHQISMRSFNGAQTDVVQNNFGRILIRLGDGRELSPFIPNDELPDFGTYLESKTVEFPYIGWKDADGVEQEDFRLALRYELWPGGKGFAFAFFYAKKNDPVDLDEFSLKFDLALSKFPDTTWGIRPRPESYNGANIQSLNLGRNLPRQNKHADGNIICSINANARQKDGQSAYFEINIDGQNSLSGNPNDNYSDFIWNESGDLSAEYGFIKEKPCKGQTLHPWQWRNQWSWVIKYADKKRHKPPFHMYHYLDNFQKYPSDECLEMIEKNGADVLIIHENWRFDIQNDGFPADAKKLRHVIEEAHKHNIRVALYMRGDEVSAVETACEWFDRYLKKDFDGFYMDYAGPFHPEAPTESYPGGRIEFHRYFLRMRSLRERIGKDGIFYGHSGTSFSGIGFVGGIIDGYVSGEGEGGIMVNSRKDHEYFSMAPVCVATMWTGAFPAYSTEKMTPFLAAAGQYPHSPLGVQLKSSSLAHPQEPGLNDIAFRPLWKIWHCFRHERNILIYNDYNSTGVFADRDSSVGHYLMVSENGNKALLVVSNFKQEVVTKNVTVHFGMTAFNPTGKKCWKYFEEKAEEQTFDTTDVTCSFRLKQNGVSALYFNAGESDGLNDVREYLEPYPAYSKSNLEHIKYVDEQKKLRESPIPTEKSYLQVTVPNMYQCYEFSLIYDLYLNSMQLVEFLPDGTEKKLGWISRNGLVQDEPKPDDYIWPDTFSPWIPLHEILETGKHFIGIKNHHLGTPFYSFLIANISNLPCHEDIKQIQFVNELEPNREYIRWNVNIR